MKNYGNNNESNFAPWIQPNGGNSASTGFKYGITDITIGRGVTSIGDGAFENCSGVTTIIIPEGVTTIGARAFSNCSDLSSVILYRPTPSAIGANAFDGNAVGRKIYVPSESLNTYKSAWSSYADQITILEKTWPLTLEAKEAGAIVKFYLMTGVTGVEYSTDGGENWSGYTSNTAVTLTNIGDKVSFRGTNAAYANNGNSRSRISCDKDCYVYGNIMSLINKDNFTTNTTFTETYALASLFIDNTFIKNHSSKKLVLPATTLTNCCYASMFYGCTGLTSAPELPATTLVISCYVQMFRGCTGLTSAPELSATTLANKCYDRMFYGCTNLNKVICMANSYNASNTENWLEGVAASGTFIKAIGMNSWGTGVSGIPSGWTAAVHANTWADLKTAMNAGDNVILTGNCTDPNPSETSYLDVPANKTVVLDLNGYTIDRGLATSSAVSDGYVIKNHGTLTIQDGSTGKTGVITGGNNNNTGTESYMGGGIYNSGTLTINGGSIENNMASQGGGIYNVGTLNISGATRITGNTLSDGTTPSNLYISNHYDGNYTVTLSAVTDGASIGVTMQTPGTFTTGLTAENVDAQMAYFSSDNVAYYVTKDNNQLKLAPYTAVHYTDATFATPVRGYATLTEAFAAAGNDEGVKLFADVNEYVTFQKTGGTTVTLDLNDKVIKSSSGQTIAMSKTGAAEGNVTLNIVDNANTKTTRFWEFSGSNKYWTIKEDQEAANNTDNPYSTLGGCITGGNGGIGVGSSCVLNLNGGNVVGNNKSSGGGGIYVVGTCTIGSGAKVCGNYAGAQGGGVAIMNDDVAGTLYNNGSIIYNYANTQGGGVYVYPNCTFTNTGQINNNTAKTNGGGVFFNGATLNLSGALTITGNTINGTTPNNIYLPTGKLVTITDDITGSNIGVTMQTPGVFTSGLSTHGTASSFTCDDTSKDVGLNADGEAIIGTPYTITTSATNGEISTTPATTAVNGALVSVTATPNEGSTLINLTYTPAGGAATDIITTKQFEMPAANVAISAVFLYELTSENVSVPNATYNGASQTAVVKYGETTLTKDTHYTVTGTDTRTNAGTTESFTITGKGDYTGSVVKTFTIAAADLSTTATVSGSSKTVDYDGETSPAIDVTVNFPETDYTIAYRKTYQEGADVTTIPTNAIGEYTVVLKPTDTGNLTGEKVTDYKVNVQLPINLKQCEWTTYFDERFDLATPAGYKAYKVSAASASGVTAVEIDYIPKNVPVILKTTASGTSINSMTVRFNEQQTTSDITGSASFKGVPSTSTGGETPTGTNYILVGDKFVLYEGTDPIPAQRCYLALGGAATRGIGISFGDGDTTGLSGPPDETGPGDQGQWYDLQGRRIEKPTKKGLYIKDGKKVVITGKEARL